MHPPADGSNRPPPGEGHGEQLSIGQVATQLGVNLTPLPRIRLHLGSRLAHWLLAIIVIVLLLIGAFAWLTYPSLEETRQMTARQCQVADIGSCNLVEVQQERVTVWFDQVKDLTQILVVSLLIPLLATLIGYLFSRRDAVDDSG